MFENVWTTIITLFWLVLLPGVLFIVSLVLAIYYLSKRNTARRTFESEFPSDSKVAPK
jgi:hypothetical protein